MSSNTLTKQQLAARVMSLDTPMDQQVKESIMTSVMAKVDAIADKPEDEVIENKYEHDFRKLVYV